MLAKKSLSDILENTCAYWAARPGTPALIGCYRFVQHLITRRSLVESSMADLPLLAETGRDKNIFACCCEVSAPTLYTVDNSVNVKPDLIGSKFGTPSPIGDLGNRFSLPL